MSGPEFDEHGWADDEWHKIHYAAWNGDMRQLKQLEILIDKGDVLVDLETKQGWDLGGKDGWRCTALHLAAQTNQAAAMEFLLDKKANIDKTDGDGRTALMLAVKWKKQQTVRLLLDRKADRTLSFASYGDQQMTALEMAKTLFQPDREIITMLEALPAPEAPPAPFPRLSQADSI